MEEAVVGSVSEGVNVEGEADGDADVDAGLDVESSWWPASSNSRTGGTAAEMAAVRNGEVVLHASAARYSSTLPSTTNVRPTRWIATEAREGLWRSCEIQDDRHRGTENVASTRTTTHREHIEATHKTRIRRVRKRTRRRRKRSSKSSSKARQGKARQGKATRNSVQKTRSKNTNFAWDFPHLEQLFHGTGGASEVNIWGHVWHQSAGGKVLPAVSPVHMT